MANISIGVINYKISSFRFKRVYIDNNLTELTIGKNVVTIKIERMTGECSGGIALSSKIEGISGSGYGYFNLSEFNLTTIFSLYTGKNKMPNLRLDRIKADVSNKSFSIELKGSSEIFNIVSSIKDVIMETIINWLQGEMSEKEKRIVESSTNRVINNTDSFLISNSDVAIDCRIYFPPIINNWFTFAMNGTAVCTSPDRCKKYKGKRPKPPNPIVPFDDSGSLVLFLSDYLLTSFFIAGYENDFFNITITPEKFKEVVGWNLDTDLIGMFVPEIKAKYGTKNVTLKLSSTDPARLDIRKDEGMQGIF